MYCLLHIFHIQILIFFLAGLLKQFRFIDWQVGMSVHVRLSINILIKVAGLRKISAMKKGNKLKTYKPECFRLQILLISLVTLTLEFSTFKVYLRQSGLTVLSSFLL